MIVDLLFKKNVLWILKKCIFWYKLLKTTFSTLLKTTGNNNTSESSQLPQFRLFKTGVILVTFSKLGNTCKFEFDILNKCRLSKYTFNKVNLWGDVVIKGLCDNIYNNTINPRWVWLFRFFYFFLYFTFGSWVHFQLFLKYL